jgi:predicted molibdopterin-dependent oxidoreductase YjgC
MVVRTNTEQLRRLRKATLELILLDHPSSCLVCNKLEACELFRPEPEKAGRTTGCHTCNNKHSCYIRTLASEYGVTDLPVERFYRGVEVDRSNPFIDKDLNLCILCTNCVRICDRHHGMPVIEIVGRGSTAEVGQAFGRPLVESGCRFCGSCIDVCPTGALSDRYARWLGSPDTRTETTCLFCEAACALEAGAVQGRAVVTRALDGAMPICVLGRFGAPEFLNGPDRLKLPHKRVGKVLRETSWEDALAEASTRLQASPGEVFALVCDKTTPYEDRHLLHRFTEEIMKSPHFIEIEPDDRGLSTTELPADVKAVLTTGAFFEPDAAENLDFLAVADIYPTALSERADLVLPVAALLETDGSREDETGTRRRLRKSAEPPGAARREREIVCELARAMDFESFADEGVRWAEEQVADDGVKLRLDRENAPPAALDVKKIRTHFRGHRLSDRIGGLRFAGPDEGAAEPRSSAESVATEEVESSRQVKV